MSDSIEPDYVEPVAAPSGALPTTSNARGTLDEPVADTFKRDVSQINAKLRQVVYPHFPVALGTGDLADDQEFVKGADLWAPLSFIILFSLTLSQAHSLFSSLFVLCWSILLVVAFHLKLTRQTPGSLLSYVSLSGYCLFPQVINSTLCSIVYPLLLRAVGSGPWKMRCLLILKLVTFVLCSLWSFSSVCFVSRAQGIVEKYPLALCFIGIGWLCVVL